MSHPSHAVVRNLFAAMSATQLTEDHFTPDAVIWVCSSGESSVARYVGGSRLLQALFPAGLTYTVDSVTAEDDRAAAEVRSHGTLADGTPFNNRYVFTFVIRDGKFAALSEVFNPDEVRAKINPRITAMMAAKAGEQQA